jgi:predicted permease
MLICYEIDQKFNKHLRTDDEIEEKSAIKTNADDVEMQSKKEDNEEKEIFEQSSQSKKQDIKEKSADVALGVLIQLCKVTPLYGVIIGIIYRFALFHKITSDFLLSSLYSSLIGWDIEDWLNSPLTMLSNTVSGATAFIVGVHLVGVYKFWRSITVRVLIYTAMKLIVYPLISCLFFLAFDFEGTTSTAAVVLSMMPIAFPSYVLAKRYKTHANVVSATLAVTYLLSFPFIVLWVEVAQSMFEQATEASE